MTEHVEDVFVIDGNVRATEDLVFVSGYFDERNFRIPYFTSTLSSSQAANYLSLASDLPGAQYEEWSLDELYQREVDWKRVLSDITKYLKDDSKPRFFNALTVALVPFDSSANRTPNSFDETCSWEAPPRSRRYSRSETAGPVRINWFQDWESFNDRQFLQGSLSWNQDQVRAVAIDGQHRLAAIKKHVDAHNPGNFRVPVIFLLFDSAVGFRALEGYGVKETSRRIFMDLNQNAKTVKRARQILLDDMDPVSLCTRALLANEMESATESLDLDPSKLPLSLVDWVTDGSKFQEGPFITTVLGIEEQVRYLMDYTTTLSTEYSKRKTAVKGWKKSFALDASAMLERIEQCDDDGEPHVFTEQELLAVQQAFTAYWANPITYLLTEFAPYRELIDNRAANGSLSKEWQWWSRLNSLSNTKDSGSEAQKQLDDFKRELLAMDPPHPVSLFESAASEINALKHRNLAFFVVFQRALFRAMFEWELLEGKLEDGAAHDQYWNITEEEVSDGAVLDDLGEADEEREESNEDDLDQGFAVSGERASMHSHLKVFVDTVSRAVTSYPDLLKVTGRLPGRNGDFVWLGSIAKTDEEDTVDFTKAASNRASCLLFLIAVMQWIRSTDSTMTFDDFVEKLLDEDAEQPLLGGYPGNNFRKLYSQADSMGGRIVKASDGSFDKQRVREVIENRLRGIWDALAE